MSRLVRAALLAYPRTLRERDGAVLLDCAAELMASGSSAPREAAGLVRGGLAARAGAARADVRAAPWRAAAERLAVPLAGASLAWWTVGASPAWSPGPLGRWWTLMLAGAALALIGAVTRQRTIALAGWAATALLAGETLLASEVGTQGSRFDATLENYSLNMVAAFGPAILLGLLTATQLRGPARVGEIAWVAPAVALGAFASSDGHGFPAAEHALVAALVLAGPVCALLGRRDATRLTAAVLLGAAAAPEVVWLSTIPIPYPGAAGALAVLAALGLAAALVLLAAARRAGRIRARA